MQPAEAAQAKVRLEAYLREQGWAASAVLLEEREDDPSIKKTAFSKKSPRYFVVYTSDTSDWDHIPKSWEGLPVDIYVR